jgi:hypothetical protein
MLGGSSALQQHSRPAEKRAKDRSQVTDTMCSNQVADYRVHTMKKKLFEDAALG